MVCGKRVADRLRVLGAALHHVGDQHDLVVGVRVDVRRVGVVLGLEGRDEVLHHLALVGRVELHDAHIAERGLAGLLLEAEGQPDGADLDRRCRRRL